MNIGELVNANSVKFKPFVGNPHRDPILGYIERRGLENKGLPGLYYQGIAHYALGNLAIACTNLFVVYDVTREQPLHPNDVEYWISMQLHPRAEVMLDVIDREMQASGSTIFPT